MQGKGGADPDGMSVSLFQGRLLRGLPRGGSGLDRGLRVWAVILGGGGKKGRAVGAGRGGARVLTRGQEEATSGREALAGRPPPPRRRD